MFSITYNDMTFTRSELPPFVWKSPLFEFTEINGKGWITDSLIDAVERAAMTNEPNTFVYNDIVWFKTPADVWQSSPTIKGGIIIAERPGYTVQTVDHDGTIIHHLKFNNKTFRQCVQIATEMSREIYERRCAYVKAWEAG